MRKKAALFLTVFLALAAWERPARAVIYEDVREVAAQRSQGRVSDAQVIDYCTGVIEGEAADEATRALAFSLRSRALLGGGMRELALADAESALLEAPENFGGYQAMMDYSLESWAFDDAADWARRALERADTPESAAYFAKMEQYCQSVASAESIAELLDAYEADRRAAEREYGGKETYLRGQVKSMKRNMLRNSTVVELSADEARVVRCEVLTDTNAEVKAIMDLKPGQEIILRGLPGEYSAKTLRVQEGRLITAH